MVIPIDYLQELQDEGLHILPLKYNNGFIHPDYQSKFNTGFDSEEIKTLYESGFKNAVALMHGKCNPGLMCLDFDEKNAPGVNLFDKWKVILDDFLFQKLVIEKTRSNGYHVYFKCDSSGPLKALASSETGREWIALRSSQSNCITYCAPSQGYTELQGSLADIQVLSQAELTELCDAAIHLNKYEGKFSTEKNNALTRPLPPDNIAIICRIFDNEIDEFFIPELLTKKLGWTYDERTMNRPVKKKINGEEWHAIKLFRPGGEFYSANYWIQKKRLSVFSSSTELPAFQNDEGLSFSHTPSQVLYYLNKRNWQSTLNDIIFHAAENGITFPEKRPMVYLKKNSFKLDVQGVLEWASDYGYRWIKQSTDEEAPVMFIQVVDNIIYNVTDQDVIHEYLKEIDASYGDEEMKRCLFEAINAIPNILIGLPYFNEPILRDTKEVSYLFFKNGVIKINKTSKLFLKYGDINGYIWSKYIINHDYIESTSEGDFKKFLSMVSTDSDHFNNIVSSLGYMLHSYKARTHAKAIVIVEDVEDESEARGRSGKGLIAQFIELFRNTVQQDGRNFKLDDKFKMQRINISSQVFYLNDPPPATLFSHFYNMITDDFIVEQKGKKSFTIPYKFSPKLLVTTNYLPVLQSDSDKDRFQIITIKKVFDAVNTIAKTFPGVEFFNSEHWHQNQFYSAFQLAIECIQYWLNNGIAKYVNETMERNAAKRAISAVIPDYISEVLENVLEAGRKSKNTEDFKNNIIPIDFQKQGETPLSKAVDWYGGELSIHTTALYRYCVKAYTAKTNDKIFGKKVREYFRLTGIVAKDGPRNEIGGRSLIIKMQEATPENTARPTDFTPQIDAPF